MNRALPAAVKAVSAKAVGGEKRLRNVKGGENGMEQGVNRLSIPPSRFLEFRGGIKVGQALEKRLGPTEIGSGASKLLAVRS